MQIFIVLIYTDSRELLVGVHQYTGVVWSKNLRIYNAVSNNDDDDVDVTFTYCSARSSISKMFLL